jgi:formamidopyrimidine-DNA glycosylase
MPELPEVESIRRLLRVGKPDHPALIGKVIKNGQVFWPRTLAYPGLEDFGAQVANQEILEIGRRGKYLLFQLTDRTLIIHLRMSGDLVVEPEDVSLGKHCHMALILDNHYRLAFIDPRKFGRVWLVSDPQEVLAGLGPEPFDVDFTAQRFHELLQGKHRQLKPLLLDQSFLAGLGNIYTDEALHMAGLYPLIISSDLLKKQSERLLSSIREVLEEGIRRNGASIDWVYRGGDFQNYFRVYQRTGQPCFVCRTPIEKCWVGQRGTHYCPNCQRPGKK